MIEEKNLVTMNAVEDTLTRQSNDALKSFRRLFGFCSPTISSSSDEKEGRSLAVSSELFTNEQLMEISTLGETLVLIKKNLMETKRDNDSIKVLSDHISQRNKEIICNQNKHHQSIVDELHQKFAHLEEKLQDAVNILAFVPGKMDQQQSKRFRDDQWMDQLLVNTNKKQYAVSHHINAKMTNVTDDSKFPVTSSSSSSKATLTRSGKKNSNPVPPKTSITSSKSQETERDPLLWIQDPKVRRKAQQLAEANVAYDPNASPLTLLNKYVYRIFENNNICYGLLALYEAPYFLVIYNDGDSQRLSLREVQLSLLNEQLAPTEELQACKFHAENLTYMKRIPLPPM